MLKCVLVLLCLHCIRQNKGTTPRRTSPNLLTAIGLTPAPTLTDKTVVKSEFLEDDDTAISSKAGERQVTAQRGVRTSVIKHTSSSCQQDKSVDSLMSLQDVSQVCPFSVGAGFLDCIFPKISSQRCITLSNTITVNALDIKTLLSQISTPAIGKASKLKISWTKSDKFCVFLPDVTNSYLHRTADQSQEKSQKRSLMITGSLSVRPRNKDCHLNFK